MNRYYWKIKAFIYELELDWKALNLWHCPGHCTYMYVYDSLNTMLGFLYMKFTARDYVGGSMFQVYKSTYDLTHLYHQTYT